MYLSVKKIGLVEEVYQSYSQWLESQVDIPEYRLKDIERMLSFIHNDKKNSRGSIRCVLLQELGAPMIDVDISDNEIRDALLHIGR